MSGKRQNMNGFERKRAKQSERRRVHRDKYASTQATDRPVEHEEHDHERR